MSSFTACFSLYLQTHQCLFPDVQVPECYSRNQIFNSPTSLTITRPSSQVPAHILLEFRTDDDASRTVCAFPDAPVDSRGNVCGIDDRSAALRYFGDGGIECVGDCWGDRGPVVPVLEVWSSRCRSEWCGRGVPFGGYRSGGRGNLDSGYYRRTGEVSVSATV